MAGSWIVLLAFIGLLLWNWPRLILNPWPAMVASVFVFITTVGILFLASRTALVTEVRHDGLFIQYRPFHFRWKRIGLEDLKEVYVRTYRPLLEYGGWAFGTVFAAWPTTYSATAASSLNLHEKGGC